MIPAHAPSCTCWACQDVTDHRAEMRALDRREPDRDIDVIDVDDHGQPVIARGRRAQGMSAPARTSEWCATCANLPISRLPDDPAPKSDWRMCFNRSQCGCRHYCNRPVAHAGRHSAIVPGGKFVAVWA